MKSMLTKANLAILLLALIVVALFVYNTKKSRTTSPLNISQNSRGDHDEKSFFQRLNTLAVETDSLVISECKPTPEVMKVRFGQTITIRNNDDVPHKLMHKLEHSDYAIVTVPANSAVQTKPEFNNALGAYSYSCDDHQDVGIFQVVQ